MVSCMCRRRGGPPPPHFGRGPPHMIWSHDCHVIVSCLFYQDQSCFFVFFVFFFNLTEKDNFAPTFNIFLQTLVGSLVAMVGSGMLVQSIPYEGGFGAKQMAWMLHSGVIGTVIAPLTVVGGPIMIRAALYTAGIVGSKWIVQSSESNAVVCQFVCFREFKKDTSFPPQNANSASWWWQFDFAMTETALLC